MYRILIAFLLMAFTAQAASPTTVSRGDLLKQRQYRTTGTGAVTYYVDASIGADSFSCTDPTTPCLTIQAAVNKVPKLLRDLVTISTAAGSYAGYIVSGFTSDVGTAPTTAGLAFTGAVATSTGLASGTATGTSTAGSAGTTNTFGTLTDSGQAWTINNLRGKLILKAGETRVIASNTATVITVIGTWTSPGVGTAYTIQDSSVNVNTSISQPPSGVAVATANSANVLVTDNNLNWRTSSMSFVNMKFTNTTGTGIRVFDGTNVEVDTSQFVLTNSSALVSGGTGQSNGIRLTDVSIVDSATASGTTVSLSNCVATLTRALFVGGNININGNACSSFTISSTQTTNAGTTAVQMTNVAAASLTASNITSTTTAVIAQQRTRFSNFTGGVSISGSNTPIIIDGAAQIGSISAAVTCTASGGVAVRVTVPNSANEAGSLGSYGGIFTITATGCGGLGDVNGNGAFLDLIAGGASTGTFATILAVRGGAFASFAGNVTGSLVSTTADIGLDGPYGGAAQTTSTFAAINSAACFSSLVSGSRACKQ